MITSGRILRLPHCRNVTAIRAFTSGSFSATQYGRTAVYRRSQGSGTKRCICKWARETSSVAAAHPNSGLIVPSYTKSPLCHSISRSRSLHTSAQRFQQAQPKEDIRDPPIDPDQQKGYADSTTKGQSGNKTDSGDGPDGSKDGKENKSKKEEDAPPPPHGDKTPWQVFTETLRGEFKASQEWNESTKQLADSAHQFRESESVRRARAAYDATAGAAGTKTAQALKTTATAIGSGAAWTWDSKVVQGVRQGVNATGRGIEKATRPVRETEAFKNIKEAVDDGSSTRYGGWIEKEDRRKRREARELKEVQSGRRPIEKLEEDPK